MYLQTQTREITHQAKTKYHCDSCNPGELTPRRTTDWQQLFPAGQQACCKAMGRLLARQIHKLQSACYTMQMKDGLATITHRNEQLHQQRHRAQEQRSRPQGTRAAQQATGRMLSICRMTSSQSRVLCRNRPLAALLT